MTGANHPQSAKEGQMFENGWQREKKEPIYEKYAELIELMRIPAVEHAIKAALTQILALRELEKEHKQGAGHNQ